METAENNVSNQNTPQTRSQKVIVEAVVVFITLIIVSVYLFNTREKSLSAQKQAVIERLQDANAKPLSSEEKSEIVNFVSRGGATYSDAEKEEITMMLRAQ